MTEAASASLLASIAVVGGVLIGFWIGMQASRASTVPLEIQEERWKRLDEERRRLLDLMIARTPAEVAELERAHADAERPRQPPTPPPAWTRDPRVQGHPGRVVQNGNLLQLRVGARGDERVKQQFELGPDGGIVAETFTPRHPSGA